MKTTLLTLGTIVSFMAGSTLLTSCGSENKQEEESAEQHDMDTEHSHEGESMAALFACSMHPEITGKEGDKCSKCGMALVASMDKDADGMNDMDMTKKASCPMHPEITGDEGDKCSKCSMALALNEAIENEDGEHNHEN